MYDNLQDLKIEKKIEGKKNNLSKSILNLISISEDLEFREILIGTTFTTYHEFFAQNLGAHMTQNQIKYTQFIL